MSVCKHTNCEAGKGGLTVSIQRDNVEKAIKQLKKKVMNDGILKEIRERKQYEKPSAKKRRKQKEAIRRNKKALAIRMLHEGY